MLKGKKTKTTKRSNAKCERCPALCCRDLSMLTSKPGTKSDIQEMKWELHFDSVRVYIRSHRWYLLIKGDCIYLDENNLCTIYTRRPSRCRRHNPPDCERYGKYYDVLISTPEELEAYLNGRKRCK